MKSEKRIFMLTSSIIVICIFLISACSTEILPESTLAPTPFQTPHPTISPLSLQKDNPSPLIPFIGKSSKELSDNHIGIHFEDYARYSGEADLVFDNGFKWVRIQALTDFWNEEGDQGSSDLITFKFESIPQFVDEALNEYHKNDVQIILDLWIGAGLPPRGSPFTSQKEIDLFLEYVRLIVSHFKGRIQFYEIWNEPGDIAVEDYANLIRQVAPIIREEDSQAKIIIGSIPGNWETDYPGYGKYQRFSLEEDYLFSLLESGVAPLVDGISWHPFYDNIPLDPYYQEYPQLVNKIKEQAVTEGFSGDYFADELLWRTVSEEGWEGGPPVSKTIATKYYLRAITMHRGLGVNVTINIFFLEGELSAFYNLSTILAGATPSEEEILIESIADNINYYTFTLPNNDILISLWVNGEVVENDVGIQTTITFPSLPDQNVEIIDVLKGFSQDLITDSENGNLIIKNLMIKDYPLFLHLSTD